MVMSADETADSSSTDDSAPLLLLVKAMLHSAPRGSELQVWI